MFSHPPHSISSLSRHSLLTTRTREEKVSNSSLKTTTERDIQSTSSTTTSTKVRDKSSSKLQTWWTASCRELITSESTLSPCKPFSEKSQTSKSKVSGCSEEREFHRKWRTTHNSNTIKSENWVLTTKKIRRPLPTSGAPSLKMLSMD